LHKSLLSAWDAGLASMGGSVQQAGGLITEVRGPPPIVALPATTGELRMRWPRLDCVCGTSSWRACCHRSRISSAERARHAILHWRLQRRYLGYCTLCSLVTVLLLVSNLVEAVKDRWRLPHWKHHLWEEVLEVVIGLCLILETSLTLYVLGPRLFFHSPWCLFDFLVSLLTTVSIAYGVQALTMRDWPEGASLPLLLVRFALQPTRVLAVCAGIWRARRLQLEVDALQVDFSTVSPATATISLQPAGSAAGA